jgi:hypothetical protein
MALRASSWLIQIGTEQPTNRSDDSKTSLFLSTWYAGASTRDAPCCPVVSLSRLMMLAKGYDISRGPWGSQAANAVAQSNCRDVYLFEPHKKLAVVCFWFVVHDMLATSLRASTSARSRRPSRTYHLARILEAPATESYQNGTSFTCCPIQLIAHHRRRPTQKVKVITRSLDDHLPSSYVLVNL